ncbi:uncharacterized protein VP01_2342g3 [Puccinia sorghi]|uniref:Uncharacterized protein n=1 Tax=Puccinia sorghi TaxID=27349 RepID=A0A0L6V7E9_9BASI|nr:uncharacterized protein VP01_2342g3 [Puccinia sorghi]
MVNRSGNEGCQGNAWESLEMIGVDKRVPQCADYHQNPIRQREASDGEDLIQEDFCGITSILSDLDDESTTTEDHQDQAIQQGYNINILAKKHPPETSPDQPSGTAPKKPYHSHQSISHTLPKKLLRLHLTPNKPDHRMHPATTIILNKSGYEAYHPFVNSSDFQHDNHQDVYHRNRTVKPLIDHLENSQAVKFSPERCDRDESAHPKPHRGFKNRASQQTHPEGKGCTGEHCCGDCGDCESKGGGMQEDEAALSVNLKYIRSSTFPTKNSILHSHPLSQASSSSNSSSLNLDHTSSTSQSRHHSHFQQFKTPFRNLVLGQDDLLRSN